MRKFVVMLLACAIGIPLAGTARAQTSSNPPAALLLAQSTAATTKAGSAHLHATIQLGSTGVSGTTAGASAGSGTIDGDMSWTPPIKANITGTITVGGGTTGVGIPLSLPIHLILAKKKLALKLASSKWQCLKAGSLVKSAAGAAAGSTTPTQPIAGVSVKPQAPVTIGPDTVNGVAVWHVQEGVITTSKSSGTQTATIDLYIGQSDSLMQRVVVTEQTTGAPATTTTTTPLPSAVTLTLDFSRYGETVVAKLPKRCPIVSSPTLQPLSVVRQLNALSTDLSLALPSFSR